MTAGFLRMVVGLAALPACWGLTRSFIDALAFGAGVGILSVNTLSVIGGMTAFALCWASLPHPVRAYVFGHELTHALWGLLFGARPSDFRVGVHGGSVRLTKSNMLITLAPYFFPFYTFVVILAALVTYAFLRPLPCLPLWLFLVGFTWSFHLLFTLETLTVRQPDVKLYGRIFSWTFIFLVNMAIVLVWLSATTDLSFVGLGHILLDRVTGAYRATGAAFAAAWRWVMTLRG